MPFAHALAYYATIRYEARSFFFTNKNISDVKQRVVPILCFSLHHFHKKYTNNSLRFKDSLVQLIVIISVFILAVFGKYKNILFSLLTLVLLLFPTKSQRKCDKMINLLIKEKNCIFVKFQFETESRTLQMAAPCKRNVFNGQFVKHCRSTGVKEQNTIDNVFIDHKALTIRRTLLSSLLVNFSLFAF